MTQIASDPSMVPDAEVAPNGISIDDAVSSYQRHLRAENRSPNTIKTYLAALAAFNAYLKRNGMPTVLPGIRREHLEAYLVELTPVSVQPSFFASMAPAAAPST